MGKLTSRLGSRRTGDRNKQGVDGESANGEEVESGFGEHDGSSIVEEITTAPGLTFEEQQRRTRVNCAAVEETWEGTSTLL